eukprot:2390303-Amphidinium_carterae.1
MECTITGNAYPETLGLSHDVEWFVVVLQFFWNWHLVMIHVTKGLLSRLILLRPDCELSMTGSMVLERACWWSSASTRQPL